MTAETHVAQWLQQPVTTGRQIVVTSIKGGAGKTTAAALLTRTLAHYRHDPVLALEADAALGTLPVRLGAREVRWSVAELERILHPAMRLTDVTGYLVPLRDGAWLLPASRGQVGARLDPAAYQAVALALRRYFAVTVVDSETLPGEVARTAMTLAHARVLLAPATPEGVTGAHTILGWLASPAVGALPTTVVGLSVPARAASVDVSAAAAGLRESGAEVVVVPYDRHLAAGGPIHTESLAEPTRRAVTRLTAEAMRRAVNVR